MSDFKAKMQQIRLSPPGELTALPWTSSCVQGELKGNERKKSEKRENAKMEKRNERERRGDLKEKGKRSRVLTPLQSYFDH